MMYDENMRLVMLDTLDNRVSSISNVVVLLKEQGYVPNKNKYVILRFVSMLIDAYDNIHIFNKERQQKLDELYNKVLTL